MVAALALTLDVVAGTVEPEGVAVPGTLAAWRLLPEAALPVTVPAVVAVALVLAD